MQFSINLQNGGTIRSLLKQQPLIMAKHLAKATSRSIKILEARAKREAPVNKQKGGGNLRQSIRSRMRTPLTGEVEVGAKYGIFVHEGTRPHIIRAKSAKVLANRRGGMFFGKTVRHPGTKANKFMDRAIKASESQINREFDNAMGKALDEIVRR